MDTSSYEENWIEHLMYYLLFDLAMIVIAIIIYFSVRAVAMIKTKHTKNQYEYPQT